MFDIALIICCIAALCIIIALIGNAWRNNRRIIADYNVILVDKFYDYINDNDGNDCAPTVVSVHYDAAGNILNVEQVASSTPISTGEEIRQFFDICDIDNYGGIMAHQKYSIVRNTDFTKFSF